MEEQLSGRQVGIKFGVIFGLISGIVAVVLAILRINAGLASLAINWAIIITIFVLACKEYKTENGGFMTFGKGFGIAMMTALIGGLIRSVIQYVYFMLDPEYLNFMKEAQQQNPFGPPPDQAASPQMEGMMNFFSSPEFIAIATFISAIFGGLIFGLIISAIMKNDQEEF